MKTTITLKGHKITVETEPTKLDDSPKKYIQLVGKDVSTHFSVVVDIMEALGKNEKISKEILSVMQE